jgi:hypothetical protein
MTPLATILALACALLSLALIGESVALLELRSGPRHQAGSHRRRYSRLTLAPTVPLLRSSRNPLSAGACKGWMQREAEIRAALALDVRCFLGQEARSAALRRVRSARSGSGVVSVSIDRQGAI